MKKIEIIKLGLNALTGVYLVDVYMHGLHVNSDAIEIATEDFEETFFFNAEDFQETAEGVYSLKGKTANFTVDIYINSEGLAFITVKETDYYQKVIRDWK